MIAALSGHTRRLRLGTLVLGNLFRNPAHVAKIITGLDHASGGRVELGLGANWQQRECLAYGFPFPPVGERLRRMREALQIITALWSGSPSTINGTYYSIDEPVFEPKPLQQPHPPIILGGGSKSVLSMAATFATEWNTTAPLEDARDKSRQLDELCRAQGRDPATLSRSRLISLHLVDSRAKAEQVAERIAGRSGLEVLEKTQAQALIGDTDMVVEQVSRWAAIGMDHLHFYTPRPMNRPMLERFAIEVMPRCGEGAPADIDCRTE
jgi:alkanesulfonate monooxygenase SsuD/methylene tetrahydromethanopterin reductase-like flavin-dependent oxidoreductase (luciferase family)